MKMLLAASAAMLTIATAASAQPGLNGSYYSLSQSVYSNDAAEAAIAGATPTATFLVNTVCFGGCFGEVNDSGTTLNEWLGASATNISTNSVTDLSNHVVDLNGFINIASTGSYTFRVGSDDGSELYIDGNRLINFNNIAPYGSQDATVDLGAGSHSIRLLQFEVGGGTGFTASSVVGNVATPLNASVLSTSAVPEPATWAMMLLGFGMIGFGMRARRTTAKVNFA